MSGTSHLLISSTRVTEGHHDEVRVWNRGALAGVLTLKAGDGAEVAARLEGREPDMRGEAAHAFLVDQASRLSAKVAALEAGLVEDVDYIGDGAAWKARAPAAEKALHVALADKHEFSLMLRTAVAEREAAELRIAELEAALLLIDEHRPAAEARVAELAAVASTARAFLRAIEDNFMRRPMPCADAANALEAALVAVEGM